jgi:hypothetical protein
MHLRLHLLNNLLDYLKYYLLILLLHYQFLNHLHLLHLHLLHHLHHKERPPFQLHLDFLEKDLLEVYFLFQL